MAELAIRYEDLKEKKAKEKEEEEAKKKLNEARKHYNEKKKTVKKGRRLLLHTAESEHRSTNAVNIAVKPVQQSSTA